MAAPSLLKANRAFKKRTAPKSPKKRSLKRVLGIGAYIVFALSILANISQVSGVSAKALVDFLHQLTPSSQVEQPKQQPALPSYQPEKPSFQLLPSSEPPLVKPDTLLSERPILLHSIFNSLLLSLNILANILILNIDIVMFSCAFLTATLSNLMSTHQKARPSIYFKIPFAPTKA